ncbi:MAG: Gfo/Idh/MocA family oxidoreductase [Ignisphaera sp.]|uniref:Gfo/Idh/MocA family oxidoreductase n=1 Tax=Ignisphaera aggregans TaxID=334771 RepID=A0A7C4NQG5_9CREN
MIKVGIVGVGAMGINHARVLYELSQQGIVELVGVADINYERALVVAKRFNISAYNNHRELMSRVDAAIIAVPTKVHKEITVEFIKAGIHVLIEKPIADTIENAKEIIKVAEKASVVVAIGHIERFNPAVVKLKEIIDKGLLGEVITMTARRVGPFVSRVSDVSILVDLAVHDIDVMRYLVNSNVIKVYARGRKIRGDSLAEDYGLVVLTFENNADGLVETNRLTPHKVRELIVVGTKSIAYLDYIEQKLTLYDEEWVKEAKIVKEEPLKLELLDFIEAVSRRRKPKVTALDGLYALKIAEEALRSIRVGQAVQLEHNFIH